MNISSKRKVIQSVIVSILINGLVPVVVYNLLLDHFSSFVSLLLATMVPLLDNLYHIMKHRKADAFGLFMLTAFVLSLLAFLLGGNEKLILMRESLVTGILGLIFIGSLFYSKPLIYHFAIRFSSNDESEQKGKFANNWEYSYFRFVIRLMTAVWGIALLAEAVIKTILVYELSISAFLAVSQIIFYSVLGITILWTVIYRRYAKTRLDLIMNVK
ncbi:VC0807 family protein [Neobacillus sp. PS2-9]|uniref:VC0807 family protein n=1 Tax=Neobacillus sp. PS2-9 TaxID=3070676 RepID=UPI0027E106DF|nr:VC0807 family protein [Neobacillus sp. PS2-9]WML57793.1 VC0807 family protein [Neobacillus sp. PS2-9]